MQVPLTFLTTYVSYNVYSLYICRRMYTACTYVGEFFSRRVTYGPRISPPFAKRHAVRDSVWYLPLQVFALTYSTRCEIRSIQSGRAPAFAARVLRGPHVNDVITHLRYLMNLSESQPNQANGKVFSSLFICSMPQCSLLHPQAPLARLGMFINRSRTHAGGGST